MRKASWIFPVMVAMAIAGCGQDVAAPDHGDDASPPAPPADTGAGTVGTGAAPPPPTADAVDGTGMAGAPATAPANTAPLLTVASGDRGYLTDASGSAVYYMEGNRDGSRCDADCERAWPPVVATAGQAQAGQGIDAKQVTNLGRANGGQQVVYAGHPLYRYAGDQGPGRTSGEGVKDKWGQWRLATTDAGKQK